MATERSSSSSIPDLTFANSLVVLADNQELPASRCHLRSKRPMACCQPTCENEWNS
jgi:hypothetical protein